MIRGYLKWVITFVGILALTLSLVGQTQDPPAPTPIPFTPESRQSQWRIGFDLGNAVILETPELNPDGDFKSAVREAERILPNPFLDFGLALLPVAKVSVRTPQLLNPRQWTILDLHGKTSRRTFQGLGVFMGRRMPSSEGGYHLVSLATMASEPFLGVRKEPAPEDVIFGFSGSIKSKTQIHMKLAETKWENLLPVEDTANLPAGYESAKQLLDDHPPEGQQRFLYGTSIEAFMRDHLSTLWLLNYSHPDTSMGRHPWGIFLEENGGLQPLYIYKPSDSDDSYVAYFTAAVDLNQDGTDELIVEASYRAGTAFKVISNVGGKYQEILTSYYRGPVDSTTGTIVH
jgi:hypothetical protein